MKYLAKFRVGGRGHDHSRAFTSVNSVAFLANLYAMPYETNLTIFVCRGLKPSIQELWARTKSYR